MDDAVELVDVIGQLRGELSRAMWAGEDKELRFELGPVELELTVGVQKDSGKDGKIRFWVLDAGAVAKRSTMTTQRIKLILTPRLAGHTTQTPLITGKALPNEH